MPGVPGVTFGSPPPCRTRSSEPSLTAVRATSVLFTLMARVKSLLRDALEMPVDRDPRVIPAPEQAEANAAKSMAGVDVYRMVVIFGGCDLFFREL